MAEQYTTKQLIASLHEVYSIMRDARRRGKAEALKRLKDQIDREAEEFAQPYEDDFHTHLLECLELGVTPRQVREEVLCTTNWGTWSYHRDKAGVPLEKKFWFHEKEGK